MNFIKTAIVVLIFTHTVFSMHTQKELALQLEDHPRSRICFLHHYAHANFYPPSECTMDEWGVYYNGIYADENSIPFRLSWAQVKIVLDKAYKDLADYDVSKDGTGLRKEYRDVLKSIQRMFDTQHYEGTHLSYVHENRKKYHNAWASGDMVQIKAALKLDLWPPHIA